MPQFRQIIKNKIVEDIIYSNLNNEESIKESMRYLIKNSLILRWFIRYNSNKTDIESLIITDNNNIDHTINLKEIDIKNLKREYKLNNLLKGGK